MSDPNPQDTVDALTPMACSLAAHLRDQHLRDHLHVHPDGPTNAAKQFYHEHHPHGGLAHHGLSGRRVVRQGRTRAWDRRNR